jgi:SAM-dependent methyltransferase
MSTSTPASQPDIVLHPNYNSLDNLYQKYGGDDFKIDLGCGFVKPAGFIGLDNLSGKDSQIPDHANAPDILTDLNRMPLPFADSSCREVRASHFLEHSDVMHILNECHRVLKPGGIFLFVVPYANSAEGMYPGHTIFFTEKWFHENLVFKQKFLILREQYFPSQAWIELPWIVRALIPFSFARKFFFNACWQMMFTCTIKK